MFIRKMVGFAVLCLFATAFFAAAPETQMRAGEVGGTPVLAVPSQADDALAFVPAATFAGPKPPEALRFESAGATGLLAGGPIHVLLAMADDGSGEPLHSQLLGYPDVGVVDVFDTRSATPTLATLQAYHVVVVWTNYHALNPAGLGDVLADYVDGGGRVILAVFSCDTNWGISGRLMTGGYSPFLPGGTGYSTHSLGTYNAGHPIMAGVTAASDFYYTSTSPDPGATLVASWSDGQPFVATKGCVVAINSYPGTYYLYSGDVPLVFHNAVSFLYTSSTCSPFVPDLTFHDDRNRSELCIQKSNGMYQWTNADGSVFTGTGVVANGGTAFWTLPQDPNYIYATYDARRKRARGYWNNSETGGYNSLVDTNTTNNPPCGSLSNPG